MKPFSFKLNRKHAMHLKQLTKAFGGARSALARGLLKQCLFADFAGEIHDRPAGACRRD
jgi:hypothetical protein